jgi:hypothetical protein
MHNFLKKVFGTGKHEPQLIAFEAVPAWLSEKESGAKATLASGIQDPMNEIRNGLAHLHIIINDIAGVEHDPAIHPKLKTIAKNSLPQFVRAMKGSLAKELPEDPEEFYLAAAECVKNCLHNTHGQGRYLQAIFPDEMKGVRQGVDAMGRAINTINPLLAAYRKEMAAAAAARALFDAVTDMRTDYGKSEEKIQRILGRLTEVTARLADIERELDILPREPAMKEIERLRAELADLTRQRDEAIRTYSALSMTASHVFNKAEKIATRQRHTSDSAVMNKAMVLLSDHDIPDQQHLDETLAAACPVAERMIAAGEVILKNKEERGIFSDTARFRSDICTARLSLCEREDDCHRVESALQAHPLLMKMQSLEREKKQLAAMRERESQSYEELSEWRSKTQRRIPELVLELRKKIGEMSGDNVQLQVNDQKPS